MLDAHGLAQALRTGIVRSGATNGKSLAEAGYVSIAGALVEYLKANLEVTVPPGAYRPADAAEPAAPAVKCRVS